jgi:hypothetical protein
MKKIIVFFFIVTAVGGQNEYNSINERNAFSLTEGILPPIDTILAPPKPSAKLYLTGIMRYQGLTNVFLYSKDTPKRFLTLNHQQRSDSGIQLLSVKKGTVEVLNNGVVEKLSFATHKMPTTIGPAPVFNRPTVIKKSEKDDKNKNKEKKSAPSSPRPSVIKVPSRQPKVDPSIIQKSLEYLSKTEDKEKREYLIQRLELLQSSQNNLDRKIDTNERRRQYDERRRDK